MYVNDELRAMTKKPAQLGQRTNDVLADPVREIFLFRIPGHVLERKHRDGRPVGQRRRRFAGLIERRCHPPAVTVRRANFADKTKTFARDGTDQVLIIAAVADRFASGVYAARNGRV